MTRHEQREALGRKLAHSGGGGLDDLDQLEDLPLWCSESFGSTLTDDDIRGVRAAWKAERKAMRGAGSVAP